VWAERLAEPMLAFVGRADDPRKNVQLLLDAFALVRRTVPKARLRLIGRPPRPGIHLGAGVEAVGEVDDLPSVLRSAHLFVLPSRQEGFGIVVAEALAAGVPVVTTPSGGPERLVHESGGGRVTETFEPDELAAAIVRLVTSPAELEGCRRSGRSYVIAHHAPDVFAALLSAAMRELDAVGRRSSA
jgi:phosphatidylinositol alpha-mannosyltransferase